MVEEGRDGKLGFIGGFVTRKQIEKFCVRTLPHPPAGGSSLPEGALGARAKTTYRAKEFPRNKVNGPLREGAPAKRVGENADI